MEGNLMFGELPEFLEEDYFEEHTTGILFLPGHTRRIQWFACVKTDAYDVKLFYPALYEDTDSREELLDYIEENAVQYRNVGVTVSDQIIALSTCESASTDGRVLLIGCISAGVSADTEAKISAREARAKANAYEYVKTGRRAQSLL
jgi:sortase B